MASKLIGKTVRSLPRRATFDMAVRNDAILDREVFTSIVYNQNRSHILSMLGRGFGDMGGLDDRDQNFPRVKMVSQGLGSSYINVKEEYEKADPLRVTDNSKLPATLLANTPYDVTVDRNILDEDEFFHLRDQKSVGRVQSARGSNGAEMTFVMNGLPGETFNSTTLFSIGAPLIYGMGNSQGEGSKKSNTVPLDSWQYNTFFNPMVITRYVVTATGSFESDMLYTVNQEALDGSVSQVNTGMTAKAINQIMDAMGKQVLFSTANFDPATKRILGRNNNSRYPERPSYAGIYQQLDQAPIKFTHQINANSLSGIVKIERIMQTIFERPGQNKVMFAMCQSVGYNWLVKQIREGGLQRYNVRINISPEDDKIAVGFGIEKFTTDWGTLYIYNVSKAMPFVDQYDTFSYEGSLGTPRSRDIFFFPGTSQEKDGTIQKVAKLFYKEGNVPGYGKVSRGLVFGNVAGLTGRGNSISPDSATQDMMIKNMMAGNELGSIVDGDESHVLWENTPYFNVRDTVKLTLLS